MIPKNPTAAQNDKCPAWGVQETVLHRAESGDYVNLKTMEVIAKKDAPEQGKTWQRITLKDETARGNKY